MATIKGKNMLPIGSIFFPFKVAPIRIDDDFKGHSFKKLSQLNYTIILVF